MAQRTLESTLYIALLLAAGCNPRDFDTYEETAPIRAYDAPDSYRTPGFGRELVTFHGEVAGQTVSRIMASAGYDSPVVVRRAWDGHHLGGDAFTRCKSSRDCEDGGGLGLSLIPFATWARGTAQEQTGCVFAPARPNAFVFCETAVSADVNFALDLAQIDDESVDHFSGAGLPPGHPLGVVLLGNVLVYTPTDTPRKGRVYYQPDFQPSEAFGGKVSPLQELPLRDPTEDALFSAASDAGDFGYALAVHAEDGGSLLLAVSQPSKQRVIVASFDASRGGSNPGEKVYTHACIPAPSGAGTGFGKRLVLSDVTGDGAPELLVGHDPMAAPEAAERIWLYAGSGLPEALAPSELPTDCPGWQNAPREVACPEGGEVECTDSAFGAAFAVGDVDGDGRADLLVGAPRANVDGASEAGAVWVLPNQGGDDPFSGEAALALTAADKTRAHLGLSVAALRTRDRDEPVAGAPGEDRLYLFACTDLETENRGQLCLPR